MSPSVAPITPETGFILPASTPPVARGLEPGRLAVAGSPIPFTALAALLLSFLTLLALAIHGYHPFAEDGGLYMAGIEHRLDPTLFPHNLPFVQGHPRISAFTVAVAALTRVSHLSLETVLFALYLASIWLTLYAIWKLAARCFKSFQACVGASALVTVWMTLPLAGTSLLLLDPYLTARSLSTPFSLLALVAALDLLRLPRMPLPGPFAVPRFPLSASIVPLLQFVLWTTLTAAMHPLMAGYAIGAFLLLACAALPKSFTRTTALVGLCAAALAFAALIQAFAPPETPAYLQVALSRSYWFLARWEWYELIGLLAPLVLFGYLTARASRLSPLRPLGLSSLAAGVAAILALVLFGHAGYATHRVALLQPLRVFALIYLILLTVLGGTIAEALFPPAPIPEPDRFGASPNPAAPDRRPRLAPTRIALASALFCTLAAIMVFAERQTYPASNHLELPSTLLHRTPRNPWEQAFLWARDNTPTDALFALDSRYIRHDGEDAQVFRAIAGRSMLPDYTKDGGDAANTPALAEEWYRTQSATLTLSRDSDAQRLATLQPLGVTWLLLDASASTAFPCPYRNAAAQVCRLPLP